MCILRWAWPTDNFKVNCPLKNWQNHYPYGPGLRNGKTFLRGLSMSLWMISQCLFVKTLRLPPPECLQPKTAQLQRPPTETSWPLPCAVPNEDTECSSSSLKEPHCLSFPHSFTTPSQGFRPQATGDATLPPSSAIFFYFF